MKIVYIAKFDEFYHTGNYVHDAFLRQLVKVVKVSPDASFDEVKRIINHEQPDFVLYGKVLKINQLVPWLKNKGIPSVFWLYDMAWGSSPVAKTNRDHILRMNIHQSNLFFSTDGGHDKEWATLGVDNITLRQGIHILDHALVPKININFDILFTGHPYFPLRSQMISFLKGKYGKRFRHVTSGLRGLKLNEAVQSTKIVVADSYPSPKYWSNRVYEMTGRNGFVVHSAVEGLSDEFTPEYDIVTFPYRRCFDELEAIIDRYLECDQEREQIREHGFHRCPTYDDRIRSMLSNVRSFMEKSS